MSSVRSDSPLLEAMPYNTPLLEVVPSNSPLLEVAPSDSPLLEAIVSWFILSIFRVRVIGYNLIVFCRYFIYFEMSRSGIEFSIQVDSVPNHVRRASRQPLF